MNIAEIIKKTSSTIIQTKTALSGHKSGYFKVRTPGAGYDFDQLRDYQEGDDVRHIDWKSTARTQKLLVREYRDERSRTTHVIIDCSSSMNFGSQEKKMLEVAQEVAAALIIMAHATDDALGLHYVSARLEKSFMPRSGEKQMTRLLGQLGCFEASLIQTSLKQALERFGKLYRRRSLVFIISDFLDEHYETALRVLSRQHEVGIIRIRDVNEIFLCESGKKIGLEDSEYSKIEVSEVADQDDIAGVMIRWREDQEHMFKKLALPWLDCYNNNMHVEDVVRFVKKHY
jgi:uncharacterized protein (DUF58 family)